MGAGPLYCFYTPYHLCYFEVPLTIARAVLAGDAAIAPRDGPVVEVVATAKRDLRADEVLDGIGWYTTYGQCENHEVARRLDLLPMGLAEGCRLTRDVARDEVLRYEDVELPRGRLADELWAEQEALFSGAASASEVDAQRPA
jgi:predicted homoserine dehydrogenase-like protein